MALRWVVNAEIGGCGLVLLFGMRSRCAKMQVTETRGTRRVVGPSVALRGSDGSDITFV